jgi:hypothetical protein
MKKKVLTVKKLQISRETLRDLENSDAHKVLGGTENPPSCQSQYHCVCDPTMGS